MGLEQKSDTVVEEGKTKDIFVSLYLRRQSQSSVKLNRACFVDLQVAVCLWDGVISATEATKRKLNTNTIRSRKSNWLLGILS
jgi:hypothetical protein